MRTNEIVGFCAVDSGSIMLTDPCYVEQFIKQDVEKFTAELKSSQSRTGMNTYPYSYNGSASATCGDKLAGGLGGGLGVSVSTGHGDGLYPVFITRDDSGRVATATIVFLDLDNEYGFGDEDDDDMDDEGDNDDE